MRDGSTAGWIEQRDGYRDPEEGQQRSWTCDDGAEEVEEGGERWSGRVVVGRTGRGYV
jgi:hypothetical protein